jgi:hypothetical protein
MMAKYQFLDEVHNRRTQSRELNLRSLAMDRVLDGSDHIHGKFQWLRKRGVDLQVDHTAADRNFKRPSGQRLPTTLFRVTSLILRPSLGAAWLAWAIRAAGAPPRRAPGH